MILPFVPDPQPFAFDAGADSLAVSGHKLIGSPIPCGMVLTRKEYVARIARSIEVVGSLWIQLSPAPATPGLPSCSGTPWNCYGESGFRELVSRMLETAQYAVDRFNDSGLPAWRNRNSVTVLFPQAAAGSNAQVAVGSPTGIWPT